MLRWVVAYGVALVAICVLDFVWLGFVARDFYRSQVGNLLLDRPLWGAAGMFYLLYAAATVTLAVGPALEAGTWTRALALGAFLGLACYGTYDLSNLATLKGWSVKLAVVDMLWGVAVTSAAALCAYAAGSRVGGG